jgi:hypothetical protein
MAITWTPTFSHATDSAFASTTVTLSGVTLGTGDALVYVYNNNGNNNGGTVSVTVAGVSATKIGGTSDGSGTVWLAQGVNAATGTVSYSCSSNAMGTWRAAAALSLAKTLYLSSSPNTAI